MFTTSAYRVEDSEVFSAKSFASLELSYLLTNIHQPAQGGFEVQAFEDESMVWRNSYEFHTARLPQYQGGLTTSTFFDTGDLRHELKFGFGYRNLTSDSTSSWPGGGIVGYAAGAIFPTGGRGVTVRKPEVGVELLRRVSWRHDPRRQPDGERRGAVRLPAVEKSPFDGPGQPCLSRASSSGPIRRRLRIPITWRQVEPRVGATYALGNNRKTLLRGSYSRFANRLNQEITNISAFPGSQGLYYTWNDANGNQHVDPGEIDFSDYQGGIGVDPNNPGASVTVNQIARDLKPPTTNEFIVGAEREILPDLSVALAYTHRSVRNTEFGYPVLAGTTRDSYQYAGNAVGTATGIDGFVLDFNVPYYGLAQCPAPCVALLTTNRSDFTETYDGVEVQLVKAFSHGWAARVSSAYNDWQQHVGPGAIIDPNNFAGGLNASGPVVDQANNINSTWQFNVSGMVQLPLGIQASANFFGRQGYPILYSVEAIPPTLGPHPARGREPRDSNRPGRCLSAARRVSARSPYPKGFPDRIERHDQPDARLLQRREQSHRPCPEWVRRDLRCRTNPSVSPYEFNQPLQFLNSRAFRGGVRIAF